MSIATPFYLRKPKFLFFKIQFYGIIVPCEINGLLLSYPDNGDTACNYYHNGPYLFAQV